MWLVSGIRVLFQIAEGYLASAWWVQPCPNPILVCDDLENFTSWFNSYIYGLQTTQIIGFFQFRGPINHNY